MADEKGLLSLLENLALGEEDVKSIDDQSKKLQKELHQAGFRIFECLSDKGYFSWNPSNDAPYINLQSVQSVKDLSLSYLDVNGTPETLVKISTIRTPTRFLTLDPNEHKSEYPHSKNDIIALHVAAKYRGINFSNIDFVFGGSTLEMLATCDASEPYMLTCIPGTDSVLISKRKDYIKNSADIGFQFERLMTGNRMDDTSLNESVDHMHIMNIGSHRVLFRAETDAIMDGSPVEIKASNPRYWGSKVMFQMISSGSTKLCHGEKGRGSLTRVEMKSLHLVAETALASSNIKTLERNILNSMESIQAQMKSATPGDVFKVSFRGTKLLLTLARGLSADILPPADVVRELMDVTK